MIDHDEDARPTGNKPAESKKAERIRELRRRLKASYDRAQLERQREVAKRQSPLSFVGLRIG